MQTVELVVCKPNLVYESFNQFIYSQYFTQVGPVKPGKMARLYSVSYTYI